MPVVTGGWVAASTGRVGSQQSQTADSGFVLEPCCIEYPSPSGRNSTPKQSGQNTWTLPRLTNVVLGVIVDNCHSFFQSSKTPVSIFPTRRRAHAR